MPLHRIFERPLHRVFHRFGEQYGDPTLPSPATEYALDFDGVDDSAAVSARTESMEPAGDFTAVVRFRFDGTYNASRYPKVFGSEGSSRDWSIWAHDTGINRIFAYIDTSDDFAVVRGPAIGSGWRSAAMWRAGTSLYLRVDGTTYGPTTISGDAITSSNMRVRLGRWGSDSISYFEGLIERAAYWDGLLDGTNLAAQEAAIDAHFAGTVLTGSPDHAWAINEGTGSTLTDVGSVGGATMNIIGATWVEV